MSTPGLPGYPAAVLAAVRAAEVAGRLPTPSAEALGSIFPFEPDVTVVAFDDPSLPEPAREGVHREACRICRAPDEDYLWTNGSWRLASYPDRLGVYALLLEPRDHVDLDTLPMELSVELGPLIQRVERAIRSALDGVGRVHLHRWGDGGAHLHWWFIARPAGLLQLRGSQLASWLDVLPALPETTWLDDLTRIAAAMG